MSRRARYRPPPPTLLNLRLLFLMEAEALQLAPRGYRDLAMSASAMCVASGIDDPTVLVNACELLLGGRPHDELAEPASDDAGTAGDARPFVHSHRAAAERIGQLCESATAATRKGTGSYYTPSWVASSVARTVLRGVLEGRGLPPAAALSLRILDPAAGAGAFLIAMVEAIAEGMGEGEEENSVRREVVANCLRGIELDPSAAEACRLALWLLASRPGRPAVVPRDAIAVRDSLAKPPARASADIVLGNPPWGVKLAPEDVDRLSTLAPYALSGHRDSFLFFLAIANRAARPDGAIGMVLPDAVLSQVRYEGVRKHLLSRRRPLHIARLGDRLFRGATAPACALCLVGTPIAPPRFSVADSTTGPNEVNWSTPSDRPLTSPHHALLSLPSAVDRLLSKLSSAHATLGEMGETFRFHDSGINYATAGLGRALLYSGPRQHPADIPVTRGRDFAALTVPSSSAWLRHDWPTSSAGFSPRKRRLVSVRTDIYGIAPKLLLRQTGDRPVATVDRAGAYFGRSVIAIVGPSESDLLWLAAVMNSSTFAALYRALTPEVGRAFAQVKVSKLKLVPVPGQDDGSLGRLARTLLDETDEPARQRILREIDQHVADAYRLTQNDREIVDALVVPRPTARSARARPAGTS